MGIELDHRLDPKTEVYRVISFETFLSFVETGKTYLTNINEWPDKWEAIIAKLPVVDEHGRRRERSYSSHQDALAQSWSLAGETDAMWRIYSPHGTGIMISTVVNKFELIEGIKFAYVGRVDYFRDTDELLELSNNDKRPFSYAFHKRSAFEHEKEVRLVTLAGQLECGRSRSKYPTFDLQPGSFINSVTIDPRADDWFADAVRRYCDRVDLRIEVRKSTLYDPDPQNRLGLVTTWAVKKNP